MSTSQEEDNLRERNQGGNKQFKMLNHKADMLEVAIAIKVSQVDRYNRVTLTSVKNIRRVTVV